MIGRFLEQEKALRQVLSNDRKTAHLVPTWQDIEVLESVHAALGPLADFTDMLSGEERVTLSAIKPVLYMLKHEVLAECSEDTQLTADIKHRILQYLEGKYSDYETNELTSLASFLEPRFATTYIDNVDGQLIRDKILLEGSEIEKQRKDRQAENESTTGTHETEEGDAPA